LSNQTKVNENLQDPHCYWMFMCSYSGQQCFVKDLSYVLL